MNLENNHKEMATIVETFIIEETAGLIYDNEQLDKWNNLVEQLGLSGQTSIIKKDKSPIPFMHLKSNLIQVFSTLCPRKVDVSEYNITPIPLEILDLIALSKNENYFSKMQIWYDDKAPDPVCIGITGHWYVPSYYGGNNEIHYATKEAGIKAGAAKDKLYFNETATYILGKWADVKRSFAELTELATKRYIAEQTHYYMKQISEAKRTLEDLKSRAFDLFGNSDTNATSDNLPF